MLRHIACLLALTVTAAAPAGDEGGWQEQSIPLQTGWNLVWLEVDPTPPEVTSVLAPLISAGVLDSAWLYAPAVSEGAAGSWLVYDPDAPAYLNTLSTVRGGRGMFIDLSGAPGGPLLLRGHPAGGEHTLRAAGGSLYGAATAPAGTTFRSHFAFGDVDGKITSIHRYNPGTDAYVLVGLDTVGGLVANRAYWVGIEQTFPYAGPLRVAGSIDGCQFGDDGYVEKLQIEVPVAAGAQVVTVRALNSAPPPAGEPADAGGPSMWLQFRDAEGDWAYFPPAGVAINVPSGTATASLDIRARREKLAEASAEDTGSLYQALLQITDAAGNVLRIPAGMAKPSATGTWTGVVEVTDVSLHPLVVNDPQGTTAAKPMRFAVVLEVPESGSPRLLDRACMAVARDGATISYAYDPVLFPDTVTLAGSIETGAAGSWQLAADHPLNPYRHRYNPKHRDGYAITRTFALIRDESAALDPDLPEQVSDTVRNNTMLGTWTEVISGLSPEPITLSGTFRLRRLSRQSGMDSLCVCGRPGTGQPWQPDGTPGCEDAACCALVCEIDPACCETGWDGGCVTLACQNCTNPELANQPVCNP